MGKRKPTVTNRINQPKRTRLDFKNELIRDLELQKQQEQCNLQRAVKVEKVDKIEQKVDLIIRDALGNLFTSLTIWGVGLDIEKTIAVVEQLKQIYQKQGTKYRQETSIKADENGQPHLQVTLTLTRDECNS